MTRVQTCIATLLLTLIALVAVPATKPEVQVIPGARQWQVNNSSTVQAGTPYGLHNFRRRNLAHPYAQDWSSSPSYEWMVHDREGADFALYNTKNATTSFLAAPLKGSMRPSHGSNHLANDRALSLSERSRQLFRQYTDVN